MVKKNIKNIKYNEPSPIVSNTHQSLIRTFKIVVIGDGAVGKTSLLIRYTNNVYNGDYIPTLFDNYSMMVNIDQQIYNISLWDTAGQEEYSALRSLSYPLTDCFLLCYSITIPSSLENIITKWIPELKEHAPNIPIILAGLKCDVIDDSHILEMLAQRNIIPVSLQQGEEIASTIGAKNHILASALTGKNVNHLFESCVRTANSNNNIKNPKKSPNLLSRIIAKFNK